MMQPGRHVVLFSFSLGLSALANMGPGARAVHFSLVFFLAFKAPPLTSFFLRIFHRERGSNARVIEVFLLVSQSVGS